MEKTTPEKIRQGLKAHILNLYGDQLFSLVKEVTSAETLEQLPAKLKESLGLRKFFLTNNLLKTIREELLELIPWRCLQGNMISPEHAMWIANQSQTRRLSRIRQASTTNTPLIIQEYFKFFHKSHSIHDSLIPTYSLKLFDKTNRIPSDIFYLHVESSVIFMSEVKEEVERWFHLLNGKVRDVVFIARDNFYVDCSLENGSWHGIDILIVAGTVACLPLENIKNDYEEKSHLWYISGQNALPVQPEKALKGQDGLTGNPGGNGGHLLIISNEFRNMKDLVVVSNGGHGGQGQHGGDGVDGEKGMDGEDWTVKEMMIRFPPSTGSDSIRNLVVENALRTGGLKEFKYEPSNALDAKTGRIIGTVTDFYAKGETQSGIKYEVGFEKGIFQKTAFCLVSGSEGKCGKPGVHGGIGGAGGIGGQKGTVTLLYSQNHSVLSSSKNETCNVAVVLKPGRNGGCGNDGVNGICGRNGRSGQDVGYMSWSGKEDKEFPAGRYQLQMWDESDSCRKQEAFYFKLLKKHVAITWRKYQRNDSWAPGKAKLICQPSTNSGDSDDRGNSKLNEILKRIEKYKLMQRQGRSISIDKKIVTTEYKSEWWMRKILNI